MTGSSGFIGRRLVIGLRARGFRVRRLVRAESGLPPGAIGAFPGAEEDAGVERRLIDFSNPSTLADPALFHGVTHVFHLAGVVRGTSLASFRRGNVLPTEALLGALAQRGPPSLRRVVHVSSQAAAGPAPALDRPTEEGAAPAPVEMYGRSKAEAEEVVRRYSRSIPCTVIRPPAVFGPGDAAFLALFRMLRWNVSLHPGTRDKYVSLIYVDDLVQGMIDAARAPAAEGGTYFLGPPEPVQWREIHRAAAAAAGRRPLEADVPALALGLAGKVGDVVGRLTGRVPLLTSQKLALARPRYWVCSSERARRAFDFRAPTSLEEGMRTTYQWYREAGWLR